MKINIKLPEMPNYPYLAIFTMDGALNINKELHSEGPYIISKRGEDVFATKLKEPIGFKIDNESNYTPLPSGTIITITQE